MLSAQNQLWRTTSINVDSKPIKQVDYALLNLVSDCHVRLAIKSNLKIIAALNTEIDSIEKTVKPQVVLRPEFQSLITMDGIGEILGTTIMLETGDISRFKKVGNFAPYARCVDSKRLSNPLIYTCAKSTKRFCCLLTPTG